MMQILNQKEVDIMGTWAEGNFDNDVALDYLAGIIDQITSNIEDIFNSGDAADLEQCGESELMPGVEIISILSEKCNAVPPKEDIVNRWKNRYLKIYDSQIDGLDPDAEYKIKRRKVIEDTFNKLLEQSKDFW